jgi:hypothetical protein
MRTASIVAAALSFGVGTFAMTRNAHALGPVDIEIGAKAGLGTSPVSSSGYPNPLGFGIGARAGVDFLGIYGGVQLMYYFGGSTDEGAGVTFKDHTFMYGVEGGYGFTLIDILTIRPQIGIGNATFSSSVSGSGSSGATSVDFSGGGSKSNLYLEPGVTALISLGGFFVGADANLLVFPGLDNSKVAFTLHGQVGFKF